jgi:hypothetical protein
MSTIELLSRAPVVLAATIAVLRADTSMGVFAVFVWLVLESFYGPLHARTGPEKD